MAEATITHFRDFDELKALSFSKKVMNSVGLEVYGIQPDQVTSKDVTLIVRWAANGSVSSATSGTEVKIDLDDEEWPTDKVGVRSGPETAKAKCERLKLAIGKALLGGVNNEEQAIVNVWIRQFPATGWYGEGYQT